jgi:L-ascorbate metabolism protein UlaG (beta-lactamase superfamily)
MPNSVLSSRTSDSTVRMYWLGQAGVVLRAGGALETLVIDPYVVAHDARRFPAVLSAEEIAALPGLALIVTHAHYDHLDDEVLAAVAPGTPVIVPAGIVDEARERTRGDVIGLAIGESTTHGPWTITLTPAKHAMHVPPADYELSDPAAPIFSGVYLDGPARIYHAGDTIDCPEIDAALDGRPVDVALLPINGRTPEREAQDIAGNLDARAALELARRIGAGTVVPLHWDMFAANTGDPAALVGALTDPRTDPVVAVPAHGRELLLGRA